MDKFWDEYPTIKNDLNYVVKIMEKNVRCKDKVIENSILDLIYSGGKLLRPAFVLISSRFGEENREKACSLAAVIEMLHMATLVHDDIIDDSKLRRGNETIQSKYGKDYAVYIGDFLFGVCFKLLSENSSLKQINIDSNSMARICLGEVNQLNSRFNMNLSVKSYLNRISAKTAELFSLSFYTGASMANCSEKLSRQLWQIGHNIGMAFQIIDDVLDYSSNNAVLGKSTANDLKQGIFTLPIIYTLAADKNAFNGLLEKPYFSDQDINSIINIVKSTGSIYECNKLASKYSNKAFNLIKKLPKDDNSEMLNSIVKKLLMRKY